MATIKRLEDIDSWKSSRELTRQIYELTSSGEFCRDFGLKDQIRRACVSILSNIAEGFERGGDRGVPSVLGCSEGILWRGSRPTLRCVGSRLHVSGSL